MHEKFSHPGISQVQNSSSNGIWIAQ